MSKINVMLMIRNMEFGGAQVIINQLLNGLSREKFNLSLCVMTEEDNSLLEKSYDYPVNIHILRKKGRYDFGLLFRLKKLLKESKTDLLHTHGWTADVWGRIAARMAGVPVILSHSHLNQPVSRKSFLFWNRRLAKITDHFVAIGEGNKKSLTERERIPADKITVIRNVVDYRKFQVDIDRARKREELGLPAGDGIVTIIGRLHYQKGHKYFLETARLVLREHESATFLVVGAGGLERELKSQAEALGISRKVCFAGARKDVPEILAVTDVFVMSSLFEGLPLILLEAMAAGKAIAVTDIDGCRELLRNGETGLFSPPENPEAQAAAILKLLGDKDLRDELGRRAREEVVRNYNLERMLGEIEELYIGLAKSKNLKVE